MKPCPCLSVLVVLTVPVAAFGATMSITVNGETAVTALPGQVLKVDLRLNDIATALVGFAGSLQDLGNTGNLSIVGATASDARTWGATFNTAAGDMPFETDVRGRLNPTSRDLGCIAMSESGYGPGLYPSIVESVKVLVGSYATPGNTLTIRLTDLFLVDVNFVPIPVTAGADLTITVIPNQEPDSDGDGVPDARDNCPDKPNPDQADTDSDGIADACDTCPNDPLNDADHDGLCGDQDACPNDPLNNVDDDAFCGDQDVCPNDPLNDADQDGICGDQDACPNDPLNDADHDGLCGDQDTCPNDPLNDADHDGICGDQDACPNDPLNDVDQDGICGDQDACPNDPLNDADHDGLCGDQDTCPASDTSATIIIEGCDTGVANKPLAGGCTMADEIAKLAQTGGHVSQLTNAWKKAGLITSKEKNRIQDCAASAATSTPAPATTVPPGKMKETQTLETSTESDVSTKPPAPSLAVPCGAGIAEGALLSLAGLVLLCGRRQGH